MALYGYYCQIVCSRLPSKQSKDGNSLRFQRYTLVIHVHANFFPSQEGILCDPAPRKAITTLKVLVWPELLDNSEPLGQFVSWPEPRKTTWYLSCARRQNTAIKFHPLCLDANMAALEGNVSPGSSTQRHAMERDWNQCWLLNVCGLRSFKSRGGFLDPSRACQSYLHPEKFWDIVGLPAEHTAN